MCKMRRGKPGIPLSISQQNQVSGRIIKVKKDDREVNLRKKQENSRAHPRSIYDARRHTNELEKKRVESEAHTDAKKVSHSKIETSPCLDGFVCENVGMLALALAAEKPPEAHWLRLSVYLLLLLFSCEVLLVVRCDLYGKVDLVSMEKRGVA